MPVKVVDGRGPASWRTGPARGGSGVPPGRGRDLRERLHEQLQALFDEALTAAGRASA